MMGSKLTPTLTTTTTTSLLVGRGLENSITNGTWCQMQSSSITYLPLIISALKRTKTYESLNDTRPTLRNKPSGLVNTWYDIAATPSPHQIAPQVRGYPPNPLTPYTPSPSSSFPSLPSTMQRRSVSTQSTESFFPQGPHASMDFLPMMATPNPSLAEPDQSFWVSPTDTPSGHWGSGVGEMKLVMTSFPLVASFSISHCR